MFCKYNENIDYKALGRRIKYMRKNKGLTQKDLSEMANLNVSAISSSERGIVFIRLDSIIKICNGLEVTIDELLRE